MAAKFPDYTDSTVNLACSISSHYGISPCHSTLPEVDNVLRNGARNVVLLVLDGLGRNALEYHLEPGSFLRSNVRKYYSSVFPPTTTAATTSLLSGLSPLQHGWLGWSLYFPSINKYVSLFPNTISGTNTQAASYNVADRYMPYESLIAKIQKAGFHAYISAPYESPNPSNFSQVLERVEYLCGLEHIKFVYVYYEQPDGLEHWRGVYCEECGKWLRKADRQLQELSQRLHDTVLIITADHGHTDITTENISLHPEITSCFLRPPTMEPRAMNFFIRPEMEEIFAARFNEAYEGEFILFRTDEAASRGLFGSGTMHPFFSSLGQYIAASIGRKALFINGVNDFMGHHAGLTADENEIPLIICEC